MSHISSNHSSSLYGLLTAAVSGYTSAAIVSIEIANPFITENDYAHAAAIATLFAGWGNVLFMPLSNSKSPSCLYHHESH